MTTAPEGEGISVPTDIDVQAATKTEVGADGLPCRILGARSARATR